MTAGLRSLALVALGTFVLAFVTAGLGAQPPGSHGQLNDDETTRYILCALAAAIPYAAAVILARHGPVAPFLLPAIVAIGLAARLAVLAAPPLLSTDIYRYVWDGRVQAAGINPYLHVPADPALEPLRDQGDGPADIFGNINRADFAPTIYPPAAQALFALMARTAPGIWAMKAAMMGFDLAAGIAAFLLLRAARLPTAMVLVWAWHPLVIWEFANEGHIDAAAIAFSAIAMLAAIRLRPAWAGGALGIAVLLKLLPLALVPALWRPPLPQAGRAQPASAPWRLPASLVATILAGYACYAGAGWRVFGYLPGYAAEEGAKGFYLTQLAALVHLPPIPRAAYALLAAALLAVLALRILLRPLPATPAARAHVIARDALILSAALLAVVSPHYPWYMTMLILPATIRPAWSALWPTLAAPLFYFGHDLWVVLPAVPLLAIDIYLWRRLPLQAALAEGTR